jgi:P-type E1-E2 ATPase
VTGAGKTLGPGIEIPVPAAETIRVRRAVLDFNGTLALDGALLPGVAPRLRALAKLIPLTVLTADTFGTAAKALSRLPLTVHTVRSGRDKAAFVSRWRSAGVAAIGNGANDAAMFREAALSVAILGPEGLSTAALRSATVVVPTATAALDLLLRPKRVSATLRR